MDLLKNKTSLIVLSVGLLFAPVLLGLAGSVISYLVHLAFMLVPLVIAFVVYIFLVPQKTQQKIATFLANLLHKYK